MFAIFLLGPPLEAALGRARFTVLYLISALGGTAASSPAAPAKRG